MESAKLCVIYVCIFAMFACNHALKGEPTVYSKFDYDEKLLEKLVRTEYKMELYEKRMQEMTNTFKEERETIHGMIDTFKSENSDMAQKMADIEEKNDRMTEKNDRMTQDVVAMEMRMYQVLNATLQKALADAHTIADQASVPVVAFHAKDLTKSGLSSGERLIFPIIIVNHGDGYDPSIGIFTAHVRGIYVFSVQFYIKGGKYITAAIKKNDDVIAAIWAGHSTGWNTSPGSFAVIELDVGDIVSVVKVGGSADALYPYQTNYWITFSGTLVNAIH